MNDENKRSTDDEPENDVDEPENDIDEEGEELEQETDVDDGLDEEEKDRPEPKARDDQSERRGYRGGQITLVTIVVLIVGAYGYNCYLNLEVAEQVRLIRMAEDQRLEEMIEAGVEDEMLTMDWMLTLYRARRRYIREISDEALLKLAWWRWNLTGRFVVDISDQTKRDITGSLTRAASSCEGEIRAHEDVLDRLLVQRSNDAEDLEVANQLMAGQYESCRELREAVAEARPGFWPALESPSLTEVPRRLLVLMPQTTREAVRDEGGGR